LAGSRPAEGLFEATLRDLLASGHRARFRAEGDSMHPAICCGDYVEVEPCAAAELRRGDIILAATARGLTAHRIVRISRRGIVTRGDNALRSDAPVDAASVLGRVSEVEEITNHSRPFDKSVKIIRLTATFIRRLRKRFQR
jgi:phage repressor protein C with HTH and peptisase S24 domain